MTQASHADTASDRTVEALAAETGVTVRNIRAYTTAGLLPPLRLKGRLGLYDEGHVQRLGLIRRLRAQGFGIEAIRRVLGRAPDDSLAEWSAVTQLLSGRLFATETPVVVSAEDLAAKWQGQMTPVMLSRLTQAGLYRQLPGAEVEVLSPALGQIGEQLAELGLPLAQVVQLQEVMAESLHTLAKQWLQALADSLLTRGAQDPAFASRLLAQAQPLIHGAVLAAFPVVLQQELDALLPHRESTDD